jgi:hypothetical protein
MGRDNLRSQCLPLGRRSVAHWSYQTLMESRVTYLRTRTTSTPLLGRLNLLGADAAKLTVPTGAIAGSHPSKFQLASGHSPAEGARCLP